MDFLASVMEAGPLQVIVCVGALVLLVYSIAKGGSNGKGGGNNNSTGGAN